MVSEEGTAISLQLGIDIGRTLVNTEHWQTPDSLRAAAQKIVEALDIKIENEPVFILGLGFGCAYRRRCQIEPEVWEIMGDQPAD